MNLNFLKSGIWKKILWKFECFDSKYVSTPYDPNS